LTAARPAPSMTPRSPRPRPTGPGRSPVRAEAVRRPLLPPTPTAPTRRARRPRSSVRTGWVLALTALAVGAATAAAQDAPTAGERLGALAAAFDQVAIRARAGAWQAADAAYNDAVGLLDTYGPGLAQELGEPGRAAISALEGELADLVDGLEAEDATAVSTVVAIIRSRLRPLAPGEIAPGAPMVATTTLLDWRSDLGAALAAGEAGQWNDMRDAATELSARIDRGGPAVAAALGDAGAILLTRLRVFVLRVRGAALDRELPAARLAGEVASQSLAAMLDLVTGGTPAPTRAVPATLRFRVLAGEATSIAVVGILAEGIPDVGLGSFRLRLAWTSSALALRDVEWDIATGTVDRGGGPGSVILGWPPAPTGPRGSSSIARLTFDVVGPPVTTARDYLPTAELEALESALAAAGELFRTADVPRAAAVVTGGYLDVATGRGRAGSLWEELDSRGLMAPTEMGLLALLEALSRPDPPDVILERLEAAESLLGATVASYAAPLTLPGAVAVTVEALEAFDTRGAAVPTLPPQAGHVFVRRSPATAATASEVPPAVAGSGTAEGVARPPAGDTGAVPRRARRNVPAPLVGALAIAAAAGAAAVLWSRRAGQRGPADG
jgi:hypothetical protein